MVVNSSYRPDTNFKKKKNSKKDKIVENSVLLENEDGLKIESLPKYWVVRKNISKFWFILTLIISNGYKAIYIEGIGLWFFSVYYSANDKKAQYILQFNYLSILECWWVPVTSTSNLNSILGCPSYWNMQSLF